MRFRLFAIPIRVDPTFLIIAMIGGFRRLSDIAAWTAAAFVAVLVHEMGHALTARAYGIKQISVTLFAMGGVTTYPAEPRLSPGRQFAVSAAGSAAGIVLGGAAFVAGRAGLFDSADRVVEVFVLSLVWVGAVFGLFNWLPIRPLDGGQMMTSALEAATTPLRAHRIATAVSLVVGAAAAALAFWKLTTFAGVFVVFITLMGLRSSPPARRVPDPGIKMPADGAETDDTGNPSPPPPPQPIDDFPI